MPSDDPRQHFDDLAEVEASLALERDPLCPHGPPTGSGHFDDNRATLTPILRGV